MKNVAKLRDGPGRGSPLRRPLIVSRLVGASPEKTLEMLTPPSASSPCPSVRRCWMTAASLGWLATRSRPVSFSYQRNAGTWSLRPCRSPAWLAGVVAGSCACQSTRRWLPDRIHRPRVGSSPERRPQRSSGAGRPSIWMKTTPGTGVVTGSGWRRERWTRWVRKAELSPAVAIQVTTVIRKAYTHDAQKAFQNPSTWMPGAMTNAR
jgi:hypothetical protein